MRLGDLLLNWNNQSAPGFMHGDDSPFGSVHRVELFDQWPRHPTLADTVSVMNWSATEDVRLPVARRQPVCCAAASAPSALADRTLAVLDDWVARDAPRLDADLDGDYDDVLALWISTLYGGPWPTPSCGLCTAT